MSAHELNSTGTFDQYIGKQRPKLSKRYFLSTHALALDISLLNPPVIL